eukprot:6410190-Alexandrium_andersonii.AAC.1
MASGLPPPPPWPGQVGPQPPLARRVILQPNPSVLYDVAPPPPPPPRHPDGVVVPAPPPVVASSSANKIHLETAYETKGNFWRSPPPAPPEPREEGEDLPW